MGKLEFLNKELQILHSSVKEIIGLFEEMNVLYEEFHADSTDKQKIFSRMLAVLKSFPDYPNIGSLPTDLILSCVQDRNGEAMLVDYTEHLFAVSTILTQVGDKVLSNVAINEELINYLTTVSSLASSLARLIGLYSETKGSLLAFSEIHTITQMLYMSAEITSELGKVEVMNKSATRMWEKAYVLFNAVKKILDVSVAESRNATAEVSPIEIIAHNEVVFKSQLAILKQVMADNHYATQALDLKQPFSHDARDSIRHIPEIQGVYIEIEALLQELNCSIQILKKEFNEQNCIAIAQAYTYVANIHLIFFDEDQALEPATAALDYFNAAKTFGHEFVPTRRESRDFQLAEEIVQFIQRGSDSGHARHYV